MLNAGNISTGPTRTRKDAPGTGRYEREAARRGGGCEYARFTCLRSGGGEKVYAVENCVGAQKQRELSKGGGPCEGDGREG